MPRKPKHKKTLEEKFWDAVEAKEIGQRLIQENKFNFPLNCPIMYLFADKITGKLGTCAHRSDKEKAISGWEFVITLNHAAWSIATDMEREALVFHELLHIGWDSEQQVYSIEKHDVEEFSRVVAAYGLWRPDLRKFIDVAAEKLELEPKKQDVSVESGTLQPSGEITEPSETPA
jgi:hypothetical protein